jgi:hypothetical protein
MPQNVSVKLYGALFEGQATGLFEQYQGELERVLGERALDEVDANLEGSIRVNHGVYTSKIRLEQQPEGAVVDDGWGETNDLPYGKWLEGIGSRNAPVTRFEGYHSFERAASTLQDEWEGVAYDLLDKYVGEVNA